MTTLREAAKQALDALNGVLDTYGEPLDLLSISGGTYEALQCRDAITHLRAALAEHDKKIVWVEERKAHWAEQLQLARETQERERQQREEAALAEPVQGPVWVCPDSAEHRYQKPGHCEDCGKTLVQERNFCPRCGKRALGIHTCTPP